MNTQPSNLANPMPGRRNQSRGLAMVELMLALTLGLVVIAAMSQLYSGSNKAYKLGDTLTRLNENGRFAVDFLSNDLRMGGFLSCGGSNARIANSVDGGTNWLYVTDGIDGFENGAGLPGELSGQVRAGTDVLIVRRAAIDLERSLIQDDDSNARMELGSDHGFAKGEILVISDPSCTQSSLFQITDVLIKADGDEIDGIAHDSGDASGPGNCTSKLFGAFDCTSFANSEPNQFRPGSTISRFAVHAYYITASDPPTLARMRLCHDGNGNADTCTDELVRDVENFQVLFGRDIYKDAGHTVDEYVTADQVSDWTDVVSVQFALLMRSTESSVRAESQSLTFDLLGSDVTTPNDRYLRRVFGSVVALRNNLP